MSAIDTIPNSSKQTARVLRERHVARIGYYHDAHSHHSRQV